MKILGFAFTKIHAERKDKFNIHSNKNIHIDFLDIIKENIDILKSDSTYSITFRYTVSYLEPNSKKESAQAELIFEGMLEAKFLRAFLAAVILISPPAVSAMLPEESRIYISSPPARASSIKK